MNRSRARFAPWLARLISKHMSVTYSQIASGGAAAISFNSLSFQSVDDTSIALASVWDDVESSLYGKVDKTLKDMLVKCKFRPRFYDTAQIAALWPYIGASPGKVFPGPVASPITWLSNNNDQITVASGIVGVMPTLELGVTGPILGECELWGVLPYGADPATANSYFTISTGAYGAPSVATTASLGQQEYTASWGAVAGFTSFQAQEKWTISHEVELTAIPIQGRTRAWRLKSYRTMAKCRPLGPTWAQIASATKNQGTGAGGGSQASASAATLLIGGTPGQNVSPIITIANAMIVADVGFDFGNEKLRNGEIGFISTNPGAVVNAGSAAAQLALS